MVRVRCGGLKGRREINHGLMGIIGLVEIVAIYPRQDKKAGK